MTPEEQRMCIAEACGWKGPDHPDVRALTKGWCMPEKAYIDPEGKMRFIHEQPNYLEDLNVMQDAEKSLTEDQTWQQACSLVNYRAAPAGFPLLSRSEVITLLRATARQRAEAFLSVIKSTP